MRSIKVIACTMIMVIMCTMFSGCGKSSPEGYWVLVKKINSVGVTYNSQELAEHRISEELEIVGQVATYKKYSDGYPKLSCVMTVGELGNDYYSLTMPGSTSYAMAHVDGDELSYTMEETDGTSQLFFRRAK